MAEEKKTSVDDVTVGSEASTDDQVNALAKRPKKSVVVAGVIAAVVVVAGLGMWIWHEQPSFCNAVCHSPMDAYVEGYQSGDAKLGVTPHANAGVTCLQCHEAELTTQIAEVCAWTSDNYPMNEEGKLATGVEFASEEFCGRSGCHNMEEVVNNSWGFCENGEQYNPHSSHQDYALECNDCHKIHETPKLMCNECHDMNMPEGWEAPSEQ